MKWWQQGKTPVAVTEPTVIMLDGDTLLAVRHGKTPLLLTPPPVTFIDRRDRDNSPFGLF